MKHWDRSTRKYDFLYAVVVLATLAVTRLSFLVELVEHASAFTSEATEAKEASAEARSKEHAFVLAKAGEKK